MITAQLLHDFAPHCDYAAIAPALAREAQRGGITTPLREAHWMAQMAVESAYFTAMVENLNYSAEGLVATFKTHFTAENAALYAHNPPRIANRAYGGRMGNGPEISGDGWKYRGRGFLDTTGRTEYAEAQKLTDLPLVDNPDLLLVSANAALDAGTWWTAHGVNALADNDDLHAITLRVNGGVNGLLARSNALAAWRRHAGIATA